MIEKTQQLIESLNNELENLKTTLITIKSEGSRLKEKETELSSRETKLTKGEVLLVSNTKVNEERGKQLSQLSESISSKQSKLQEEWDRMLKEKEEWGGVKESMVKERLRLENLSKEVEAARVKLLSDSAIVSKKEESLQTMGQMLSLKEKTLKESQRKVDQYLGSI